MLRERRLLLTAWSTCRRSKTAASSSRRLFTIRYSLLHSRSCFFRIVKILKVEVEGLLSVKALVVHWRLELPANLYADILNRTVARLCRCADFHGFWHVSRQ